MRGLNGGAQDPRAGGLEEGGGEIGRGLDGKPADTGEQHAAHDLVLAPLPQRRSGASAQVGPLLGR